MDLRLHHIGIAVPDLPAAIREFIEPMGYAVASPIIHDPTQTARVQFFRRPHDSCHVELVVPDGPDSKLMGAIKRGGGLNHLCYATPDLSATCSQLREQGMVVVQDPVPAVAFAGRCVAWVMGATRVLTELVEEGPDAW